MDCPSKSSPPRRKMQRSQSYGNSNRSITSFPHTVISSNLRLSRPLPSIPSSALPAPHQPLIPQKEVNQDQEGIVYRVQGSITRLRERCQSALSHLIFWDMDKNEETEKLYNQEERQELNLEEEENLPLTGNKQHTMNGVQLRPKPLELDCIHSKEWHKRLTDYQFLSGKDEQIPKRSSQYNLRAKRNNRRATVMVPQAIRRPSDPVCYCFFPLCLRMPESFVSSPGCLMVARIQNIFTSTLFLCCRDISAQSVSWWCTGTALMGSSAVRNALDGSHPSLHTTLRSPGDPVTRLVDIFHYYLSKHFE